MIWICEMEDSIWKFSTEELAKECARFFEREDEAIIYCEKIFDDEEFLERMN